MDRQGEVLLYAMQLLDPKTGAATPLCEHDADGKHWAFPLRGQWDRDGRRISDKGFTLTCAADAQGKCVRFGYKPWKVVRGGVSLADYHQACIRMVRADYCGNHRGLVLRCNHMIYQQKPVGWVERSEAHLLRRFVMGFAIRSTHPTAR